MIKLPNLTFGTPKEIMKRQPIKKGDKLFCYRARDESNLTINKQYVALEDEEPGIFEYDPYITVNGDLGRLVCHAKRFEIVEE